MDQLVPSTRLRLDNQVAVVTGGARGIGAGIVRRFVEEGAQVVFSDLLDKKGKALEEELGKNVAFYQADATSASEALNSQTGTAWTGLSEEARLQALKRVEQTPFFQRLRSDFLPLLLQ